MTTSKEDGPLTLEDLERLPPAARSLLVRFAQGLNRYAEHIHPCPEDKDCDSDYGCRLRPLLAEAAGVLVALGLPGADVGELP